MAKITFIGAGSIVFTRNLVRDILTYPAFQKDLTISLMDINTDRLAYIKKAIEKIVNLGGYRVNIEVLTDRREALKNADGVVITIVAGGVEVFSKDVTIPEKYGVDLCIGDTRGPGGIFRALRTIPIILDICKDIEELCPDAFVLNYTNPMAMLCRAMQGETKVKITGLCHSVQGTSEMLAKWIGAPINEITYVCAGINHQAFYLEYKWNGKDAYPLLREAVKDPEVFNREQVRNEMFKYLGYYVTESSGHNSEYNPWFRKRKDLIEEFCTHGTGAQPGRHADLVIRRTMYGEETWFKEVDEWLAKEDIDLSRGHEYAAGIFNAVFGDGEFFRFNGNVRNFGLIDNLMEGCCVEVPVLASKNGFQPMKVGKMPAQLAALNNLNAACEEMAVQAALTGDTGMLYHAICLDPLTSAVLSLREIEDMVNEMLEANRDYLPQFKSFHVEL